MADRVLLITRNELRLMRADLSPVVLLVALPMVAAVFLSRGFVGGSDVAVPGLSVVSAL